MKADKLKQDLYVAIHDAIEEFLEMGEEVSGVDQFLEKDEVKIEVDGIEITINVKKFKESRL